MVSTDDSKSFSWGSNPYRATINFKCLMIMEKLSTECLEELKNRIEKILADRCIEDYDYDISLEERREVLKNKFIKNITKLEELLPKFKEDKIKWYDNVNSWGDSGIKYGDFEAFLQNMKANSHLQIFSPRELHYLFDD